MTRSGTNPHQTFARDSRRVAGLERSREREIKEGVKTQKCSGKRKRHSAPRHIRNITTHRSYVTNPISVPEKQSRIFVILVVRSSHIFGTRGVIHGWRYHWERHRWFWEWPDHLVFRSIMVLMTGPTVALDQCNWKHVDKSNPYEEISQLSIK